MKDGNTAPAIQAAPRAHPSPFDKLMWIGELQSRRDLTASARRIVVLLAYHHNSTTGRCDPSIATLADEAALSKRMVNTALDELKAAGIIEWIPGNEKTRNKYTLRDVPRRAFSAKATKEGTLAKRGMGSASSSGATVIPFPGPVETDQSSAEGSEPQFTRVMNPSSPEPLKSNPTRGYDEEKGKEESQPSKASGSPASPLCPSGGDGSSRTGEGERQPEKQPEPATRPAYGKLSFSEIATPEWIEQRLETARETELFYAQSGMKHNDPSVAEQLFQRFRDWAVRNSQRHDESKWRELWVGFYQQKRPSEPYKRGKGSAV